MILKEYLLIYFTQVWRKQLKVGVVNLINIFIYKFAVKLRILGISLIPLNENNRYIQ